MPYAMVRNTGKLIGIYSTEQRAREAFTKWFESLRATKDGCFDRERPKALKKMSFAEMKVTYLDMDSDEVLEKYIY